MTRGKRGLACRGDAHMDGQLFGVSGTPALINVVGNFSGRINLTLHTEAVESARSSWLVGTIWYMSWCQENCLSF